jgi:polyisoprenoid-binding protein YceI
MKRLAAVFALAAAAALAAGQPVDLGKSEIAFSVKQMGVPVTGVFKRFKASVDLDPAKPESGSAQVDVEVASLATGNDEADTTAKDKPWLDAQDFPAATFKSKSVKATGKGQYEAAGTLTLRGKSRDVKFPFTLQTQRDGAAVAGGELVIRRTDFGIGGGEWNQGDLVANDVTVRFRIVLSAPR